MKKYLLSINAKLCILLCVFSVFNLGIHVGFHVGVYTQINRTPSPSFEYLVFVIVYLIFCWIAYNLYMEREFCSGKGCIIMGTVTLALISLFWIPVLIGNFEAIQAGLQDWMDKWQFIVFPSVLFGVSLIICVNYIICAIQIRKENKALGLNG